MKPPEKPSPLDAGFEQRARAAYRQAASQLDPATAGRLRAARRAMLAQPESRKSGAIRWMVPTGAFAVLAMAAMLIWQPLSRPRPSSAAPVAGMQAAASAEPDSELPPDADQTDPKLYQNLDFYGWLAANDSQQEER